MNVTDPGLNGARKPPVDGALAFSLRLVVMMKYGRPEQAATISQIPACMMTVGCHPPAWNLEVSRRSRRMFTATLTVLITSGTSGLPRVRVALEAATSTAELRAEKELIWTYVILASATSCGTNLDKNSRAAHTNMMLSNTPIKVWNTNSECASPKRAPRDRAPLSAIVDHTARGRPSLMTSATVPICV